MIIYKDNEPYTDNREEYLAYVQEITRMLKNMYDWEIYYKLLTDKEGENNDS